MSSTISTILGTDGTAAAAIEGFRPRPQQIAMAEAVLTAIEGGRSLVVEAGTGVGKSLGYLVPAVIAGLDAGRRVVVSTHTISLQDQLLEKDIPLVSRILGRKVRVELAKGRSNYLAPRRYQAAIAAVRESAATEDLAELVRIGDAVAGSRTGTRQEIEPLPKSAIWELVQSETGNCLGRECRHFDSDCWFHVARRRIQDAEILIVNHSLYMSDLAIRREGARILPDHDIAIFDEAHTLEGVALDHFGVRITRRMARLLFGRVLRLVPRKGRGGDVHAARRLRAAAEEAMAGADELFLAMIEFCGGQSRTRTITEPPSGAEAVVTSWKDLAAELRLAASRAGSRESEVETASLATRVEELCSSAVMALSPEGDDWIHWAETGPSEHAVSIHKKPIEVSAHLQEALFDRIPTVILTSATLATGRKGGLGHFRSAIGIGDADELIVDSPFDYARNVALRVPVWLDEPDRGADYDERIARAVEGYVERSQGGAFVLFTSYDSMQRVWERTRDRFESLGFPCFIQGAGLDRRLMIERFKESPHSVLFGTDSFWQGVDVRGQNLRTVILARLPFAVPTDPLQSARAERLRASGGNPFRDIALPEALIRFRQGFGRLVRTETDHGTVVVLDTRIVNRPYGRAFLEAIPPVPLFRD